MAEVSPYGRGHGHRADAHWYTGHPAVTAMPTPDHYFPAVYLDFPAVYLARLAATVGLDVDTQREANNR